MPFDPKKIKTVLFDLDGTLIDNFTAIYKCYSDVSRELGLEPKGYAQLRATVGGAISLTLSRLIGDDLAEEGVRRFREHFPQVMFDGVFTLPGGEWILDNLRQRGYKLGVFTNKDYPATTALLDFLKLSPRLDFIFGTNTPDMPWRKPDKRYTDYALGKMGALAEETLLVGDSPYDILSARNAGMHVACVTTGTHMPEALIECYGSPEIVFPNLYFVGKEVFGLPLPATTNCDLK